MHVRACTRASDGVLVCLSVTFLWHFGSSRRWEMTAVCSKCHVECLATCMPPLMVINDVCSGACVHSKYVWKIGAAHFQLFWSLGVEFV